MANTYAFCMLAIYKKQLVTLAILAGLNILFGNLVVGNGRSLSGEAVLAHSPEMRRATIVTFLFSVQIFSFLLGALMAAIPYKKKPYKEKLLAFSLGIAVGIQVVVLLASIAKLLFWK